MLEISCWTGHKLTKCYISDPRLFGSTSTSTFSNSTGSSATNGRFSTVLSKFHVVTNFNQFFLKLNFVLQLICRFVIAMKFQISIIIKFPNPVKLWLQVARLASPLWNLAQLDWNRLISTLVFLNGIWVASLPSRKSKGEKICMPS
jgi:hypothetical protein